MVLKYLKSVKIPDSSIVYRFLVGLSYLGQMLKIVPLHNILFESILTLGAKISAGFRGFSLLLLHEPTPNSYVFVCQKWAFFYKKTHI